MKPWIFHCLCAVLLAVVACLAFGQANPPPGVEPQQDVVLPNGKSQRAEILKAERQKNIKDAAELVDLAKDLQQEIEKNESYVLSISALKKTDEIEKLAKRIRSRMRH